MSACTLPPPRPPECLTRSYLSRGIKGGTIIAEDVLDLEEHHRRLLHPDSYRPQQCRTCGGRRNHALCFRERRLRPADPRHPPLVVPIRLFQCASCGAVFTVLPAFIARHLWRAWETVESVASGEERAPRSTMVRWLSRLASDASQLVRVFTASVRDAVSDAIVAAPPATRALFVRVIRRRFFRRRRALFARIAGWIHRLAPGVRLM